MKNVNDYMMTRITYQKVPRGTPQKDNKSPVRPELRDKGTGQKKAKVESQSQNL